MVLISQIWIQHLPCTQIVGHAYIRVGSDVDPELAFPLYTALLMALAELQKDEETSNDVHLSGIYGYRLHTEGLGMFMIQDGTFRIILLSEGFLGQGVPYLTGSALKNVRSLFSQLHQLITEEECQRAHWMVDRDESFWFNLMVSHGLGQLQIEDAITKVYPLRFIRFQFTLGDEKQAYIRTLEDTKQSLGFGFQELDELIAKKIQLIYDRPISHFQLYGSLFNQMGEFKPDFAPNSLVLIFHKGTSPDQIALVVFLSISDQDLKFQFCLPLSPLVELEGSRDVFQSLQRIVL